MTTPAPLQIVTVDAFADRPFTGNPAAVSYSDKPLSTVLMQAIASELNLSETAFVYPLPGGTYHLRWFTPTAEVELCGHATMAAAHVMWERSIVARGEAISFTTLSGILRVGLIGDLIAMDFPAEPVDFAEQPSKASAIEDAIGMSVLATGRNRMDYLAVLGSEAEVRRAAPDMSAIAALPARGLIITAPADETRQYDFVSRCFYPAVGVPEDPVTGSAHCALGPYWADRLGRATLVGLQASLRGGTVRVECQPNRVVISGNAVTVLVAEMTLKNSSLFSL